MPKRSLNPTQKRVANPARVKELPPPFEAHVREVVHRIRGAFAEVLVAVGADATRPQAVSRQLNLASGLTWKICRLIGAENSFAVIPLIPRRAGLNILIDAFARAEAPPDLIRQVQRAVEEFEHMVKLHSGDRETLEMMLGNLTDAGQQERDESHRRLAFRGNSAMWGVQARLQLCTNFIAPGTDPNMVDLAWLSGLVDFRRLKREATWAMAAARKTIDDGSEMPLGEIRALDPAFDGPDKAPLMGEFCSKPLPEIRIDHGRDLVTRYELVEGPVGNTAAATCIVGLYGRNFVRRRRGQADTIGEHYARLYTPVEVLVHDLFVHRELTHALSPTVALYSQLPSVATYPAAGRDRGLFDVSEPVIPLGGCPPDIVTAELPAYTRMVRDVFERLGWTAGDFYGFRFRLRYPPIPTLAVWRYELPE